MRDTTPPLPTRMLKKISFLFSKTTLITFLKFHFPPTSSSIETLIIAPTRSTDPIVEKKDDLKLNNFYIPAHKKLCRRSNLLLVSYNAVLGGMVNLDRHDCIVCLFAKIHMNYKHNSVQHILRNII